MDIKSIVARIKSIRFSKKPAVAAVAERPAVDAGVKKRAAAGSTKKRVVTVGVLAIAAAGGAYYFLVYQPQIQNETPAAMPPVAKKTQLAPARPPAKLASVQPKVPVSGVPATVSPNAPASHQPAIALAASAVAPPTALAAETVKPDYAMQKYNPKERTAAVKPKQVAGSEQVANKLDAPATSQHARSQPQDELLSPTVLPVEPAAIAPVEPVPMSAPAEPAPQRGAITPKYNDIMTAVLRGDRDAAKELIDLGWWVDKPSASGITPLMAAVMNRDAEMVQLLLDNGAEPTSQALKLARKNKDTATASLLEQKGAH